MNMGSRLYKLNMPIYYHYLVKEIDSYQKKINTYHYDVLV